MSTKENTALLENNSSYWQLTEEERELVNASAPDQDKWSFNMERRDDGMWQFSMPEYKTNNELLVGGTEQIMDDIYRSISEVKPDRFSTMEVTISRVPLEEQTTTFTKLRDDSKNPGSTYWLDEVTGKQAWLCPWLKICWDPAPELMYIHCELTS